MDVMTAIKNFFISLYEAICAAKIAQAEAYVRGQRGE
jgi:hypothetical protein